jgi:hypothetical protein
MIRRLSADLQEQPTPRIIIGYPDKGRKNEIGHFYCVMHAFTDDDCLRQGKGP